MNRGIGEMLRKIGEKMGEYYHFIFGSAAENHIRLQKKQGQRNIIFGFSSYLQLKRYQKKVRRIFLLCMLFFLGMLVSRIFFSQNNRAEIYIPEDDGVILTSNVGRNNATVVFKTLDAANFNKPLATTAIVFVYSDPELRQLVKTTDLDDYAVTHMIKITGLENNKDYYLKISAADSAENNKSGHIKELAYAKGKEGYLKFHTGEPKAQDISCEEKLTKEIAKNDILVAKITSGQTIENGAIENVPLAEGLERESLTILNKTDGVNISDIMYENALYSADKIQTIISWKTAKPASTNVVYHESKGGEEREVAVGSKMDTLHMAVFTNFKPGTVYYLKVKSTTEDGEAAISDEISFMTPKKNEGVMEIIKNNIKQLFKQVVPGK